MVRIKSHAALDYWGTFDLTKISVVMPIYNHRATLREAIRRIFEVFMETCHKAFRREVIQSIDIAPNGDLFVADSEPRSDQVVSRLPRA
jgi:hypothetical protein